MLFIETLIDFHVIISVMMNVQQYLDNVTAEGKISFTREALQQALDLTDSATNSLLSRLKQKKYIASPAKGYYLIIPPEFRGLGCLPPDFFIDDLMHYLKMDYYVALLSAALYHGAAHQQPQVFQVMIPVKHTTIVCGSIKIQFIKNQQLNVSDAVPFKTRTGYMNVSTPEVTARDLLNYIGQSGGIGQIATVIDELAEVLNADKLTALALQDTQHQWVQRLGYLLETLGHNALADAFFSVIKDEKLRIIPLVPHRGMAGIDRDKKWRIAKNATIESDVNDDTY